MPPKFFRISRGYANKKETNTIRQPESLMRCLTGSVISEPYVPDDLTLIDEASYAPVMPGLLMEMYQDQEVYPAPAHLLFVAVRRVPKVEDFKLIVEAKYVDFEEPIQYEAPLKEARIDNKFVFLTFLFSYGQFPEESDDIESFLLEGGVQVADVSDFTTNGFPEEIKLILHDESGTEKGVVTLPFLHLMPEVELNETDMQRGDP